MAEGGAGGEHWDGTFDVASPSARLTTLRRFFMLISVTAPQPSKCFTWPPVTRKPTGREVAHAASAEQLSLANRRTKSEFVLPAFSSCRSSQFPEEAE